MRRKIELEEIKRYVAELMNVEQTKHANMVRDLFDVVGGLDEYENMKKILVKIYDAKIEVLDKIYNKIG